MFAARNAMLTRPSGGDPLWGSVSLRMPFNNSINDISNNGFGFAGSGNYSVSQSNPKFGAAGLYVNNGFIRIGAGQSAYAWGTGDFTVELWMMSLAAGSGQCIFDFRPLNSVPVTPALFMGLGSGGNRYLEYYLNSATQIVGTTTIAYGNWYHVAICRSSGVTKMFVNGTQEGSNYNDSNSYQSGDPCFGKLGYNPSLGYAFPGAIDDVRVTNAARYTANFTVPSAEFPTS